MTAAKSKILLFGAGAVGAYFCGKLAHAGLADVAVVCRSDYETVKERGYRIAGKDGDFVFRPAGVYRTAAEYRGAADYLFVTSKVLPGIDLPQLIRAAVGPQTVIVLIQNGIDIETDLATAFPGHEIISSIAYIGVTRVAPGEVIHLDGGRLKFGVYPRGVSSHTEQLVRLFTAAGVPVAATAEIMRARWEKLVWNVPFNPISVLTRSDTAQLMADPDMVALLRATMEEVCATAAAAGWAQPATMITEQLEFTRGFKPYKPSMLIDYENGRPMEIEAIIGNVVRTAARLNVPVPHIFSIYAMIKRLNRR
ncbi:MAG: 2-dehydropantoate 2-reductase [Victivallales bacterium]|nr:2-dehydropantoate 2-reductase [Victivallales bacterium]